MYVSSSSGNDANAGTAALPFKTLAKAASVSLGPNSRIRLQRGDTWTNESLSLYASGAGVFDAATFDRVYASTLTTRLAAYQAGATPDGGLPDWTTFQAALAVSESGASANTDADEYARSLALRDALIAARDAARAGSLWNIVEAYGTGAAPVLDGAASQMYGIDLSGPSYAYPGGWQVQDVEIKNYTVCGIRAESATPGSSRGVWIADTVNVHDITGSVLSHTYPYTYNQIAGYFFNTATGVSVNNTRNVDIGGTYDNNETTFLLRMCSDSVIDNANGTHAKYLCPYFAGGSRGLWQNSVYDQMCDVGLPTGSTGATLGQNVDIVLYNVEIKNTPLRTVDGCAVDCELGVLNGRFLNCYLHDNAGAVIELNANPSSEQGTMVVGSRLENNGIAFATNAVGQLCRINYVGPDTLDHLLFVANTVVKSANQAFLFQIRNTAPTNTITDVWTLGIFGPDNTVT